jgi:hypothetical protein
MLNGKFNWLTIQCTGGGSKKTDNISFLGYFRSALLVCRQLGMPQAGTKQQTQRQPTGNAPFQ